MAAHAFWAVFCSSQQSRQIGPTPDFEGAAIPPTIYSMERIIRHRDWGDFNDPLAPNLPSAHLWFWVANLPEINIGTIYCHQWFRDTILLTHSASCYYVLLQHILPYMVSCLYRVGGRWRYVISYQIRHGVFYIFFWTELFKAFLLPLEKFSDNLTDIVLNKTKD